MHHPSILALLAVPLALASAVTYPTNTTNTTTPVTTSTTATTTTTLPDIPEIPIDDSYLITQVLGDGNEDKNGLFVSGFHTGRESHHLARYNIAMSKKADQNQAPASMT